jgi:hypothetical protein
MFALVDLLLFPELLQAVMAVSYGGGGVACVLAAGNALVANASHVEAEWPQHNEGRGASNPRPASERDGFDEALCLGWT